MNCKRVQPNLLDYSRGLLSQSEAHAVQEHLDCCAECRALLQAEVELAERLSQASAYEPSSERVWLRVQSEINPHREPRHVFIGFPIRRLAAAAAAFVVLIAALLIFGPWHTPQPSEEESIRKVVTLMQVQPVAADDSVVGTTDVMMQVLEDTVQVSQDDM